MTQLSKKQQKILNHLITECDTNTNKTKMNSCHCAAIITSGKILCIATNDSRTKLSKCCLTSIHAEINVLYKYIRNNYTPYSKLCLWVIRWDTKEKELRNSMPCWSCMHAIKKFNIKIIYFSTLNGGISRMKPNDIRYTYITRAQSNHSCIETKWNLFKSC
jgi:deoxycytidylate deaminase